MSLLKLNLGCGFQKKEGFVNVDHSEFCQPDVSVDLAKQKWPWKDNSVGEIVFDFSLEQMGENAAHLEHVLKELYRVSAPEAQVFIRGFHPRSDQFLLNPFCTQRLAPEFFHLLSVSANLAQIAEGRHDDCFGLKWSVNFDVTRFKYLISPIFQQAMESGSITEQTLRQKMIFENNICQAYEVDLKVQKDLPKA